MKKVTINAYNFSELSEKAQYNANWKYFLDGFEYEDEDKDGNIITNYDYFSDWELVEQIEFCDMNDYLFDRDGVLINHLVKEEV